MMLLQKIIVSIVFIWTGMIMGISCLEAWVKFKTPSLTKNIDLDVGRVVFRYFHRAQWAIFLLLIIIIILKRSVSYYFVVLFFIGLVLILHICVLMPRLDRQIIKLQQDKKSNNNTELHNCYAVSELIKLLLLCSFGYYILYKS